MRKSMPYSLPLPPPLLLILLLLLMLLLLMMMMLILVAIFLMSGLSLKLPHALHRRHYQHPHRPPLFACRLLSSAPCAPAAPAPSSTLLQWLQHPHVSTTTVLQLQRSGVRVMEWRVPLRSGSTSCKRRLPVAPTMS
jgi:hypothetical protein